MPTKVLTIVDENRSASSADVTMPYLSGVGRNYYGRTTAYHAVSHPSLPNYLALAGGSTFGVTDDAGPATHHVTGASVFDRAIAHGRRAKTYAEGMPGNCSLADSGRYAVRHNPWAYFSDATSRANCQRNDVPLGTTSSGALRADVDAGTLPQVGLVVPDLCDDGHDCPGATADAWLKLWLPALMSGPDYRQGRLAILITFDEDDYHQGNTVLTTVVSPYSRHTSSGRALTHYSWLQYADALAGSPPPALRSAATAVSLRPDFHL